MSKNKKIKFARITLDKNLLDISNVDGKPTVPGECCFLGESKEIKQGLIIFIEKHFNLPIEIEIVKRQCSKPIESGEEISVIVGEVLKKHTQDVAVFPHGIVWAVVQAPQGKVKEELSRALVGKVVRPETSEDEPRVPYICRGCSVHCKALIPAVCDFKPDRCLDEKISYNYKPIWKEDTANDRKN